MSEFKLINQSIAYENPFFQIVDKLYRLPDGTEHHYFVRQEVDTCCVLAMTKAGKFVAVKEYRVGPEKSLIELPAGRLDDFKDNPDEQIKQELLQETGYIGEIKKIGALPASPYSSRIIHCYYAVDCEKVAEQNLDESEFIEVVLLEKDKMRDVLMKGESSSCSPGLLAWEWMKRDGFLEINA